MVEDLNGLFVNSHAMGRVGGDDWAQGSGGDERKIGRRGEIGKHMF